METSLTGKRNSHPSSRSTESSGQDKPKEEYTETHNDQTDKSKDKDKH